MRAKRPCLTCGKLDYGPHCETHAKARKQARNASARALGPCPQHVDCYLCDRGAALPGDPLEWDHVEPRGSAIDWRNPTQAKPAHKTCNAARR